MFLMFFYSFLSVCLPHNTTTTITLGAAVTATGEDITQHQHTSVVGNRKMESTIKNTGTQNRREKIRQVPLCNSWSSMSPHHQVPAAVVGDQPTTEDGYFRYH
ncbi:hypothetical protein HanIR_Chr06g0256041 [Helianthus annuus]|nr:hypothetical protein HanIR_Chr06g0256041 [Helianthus annuus]